MNYTEREYINLISSCINDKKSGSDNIDFSKIDLSHLINLCNIHRNTGIIYVGLQKEKDTPKEYLRIFEQGFNIEVLKYSKKLTVLHMVTDALNKRGIKHIIIKGLSIARLYPQEELRTMSDIDIVVREEDFKEVCGVMDEFNGQFFYEKSNEYGAVYKINQINIEIHSRIAHGDTLGRYNYEQYFSDVFNHVHQENECTYVMEMQYSIIYAIYHMAKHFYNNGCGVRMVTDLAVMLKAYKEKLDWDYLWKELKILKLDAFTEKILWVCNHWFESAVPDNISGFSMSETIEDYIISAGVFGFQNMSRDAGTIRRKSGSGYIVSLLQWAFPSPGCMREQSEWFKDKPSILLPIAYVERFIRNAKERGGVIRWFKSLLLGKKQSEKHENILEIMELD